MALWPSQTLPPPANIASVGPPPMLPPQLQPQLVPTTSSTAPAASTVPHPRQQVFAPPVFTPRPYAQAGPATAAATATAATPAAMTCILQGGVVLAAPPAVAAVPATPAGTRPAAVTLPLRSVTRHPAVITTGPSRPGPAAKTGGPPLFTPLGYRVQPAKKSAEKPAVSQPPLACPPWCSAIIGQWVIFPYETQRFYCSPEERQEWTGASLDVVRQHHAEEDERRVARDRAEESLIAEARASEVAEGAARTASSKAAVGNYTALVANAQRDAEEAGKRVLALQACCRTAETDYERDQAAEKSATQKHNAFLRRS